MKNTLLLLTILVCAQVQAQSNSRLVFIYNSKDAAPDAILCHNGQPTDTLHINTSLVKEGARQGGIWSMRPVNAPADTRMVQLNLSEIDNKLVIIQFLPGNESNYPVWPYVMNLKQFHQMFRHEKWLKERIREAGYRKSEDLLSGYTPYIFPQANDVPYVRKTQPVRPGDTIFYDYFNDITIRDSAYYFSVPANKDANGLFPYTEYKMESRTVFEKGYFTDLDSLYKTGKVTSYYISGRTMASGQYLNGDKTGDWQHFYDTAGSHIWYTESYAEGRLSGHLKSYYRDGKLKRDEIHMPWKVEAKVRKSPDHWIDSITSGKCYDLSGNEVPFTPFNKMPECTFNLGGYLGSTIRYPDEARENGRQGRVIIKFMVTEKGRVYYPKVARSAYRSLDIEAWRTIYNMPDWQPGLIDGEPASTIFNQPIVFRLE